MDDILNNMGKQIATFRKLRFPDDTQVTFAIRLEINKNTLSAMENGRGNVGIIHYLKAARMLGCEDQFLALFKVPTKTPSLFDQAKAKASK